ncbi:MAG TPA: YciI family protein [Terriglobales bacterium]|nr:YciI family protein [Terriglobales bacterium]
MRFMMLLKATRNSEAGAPPNPELMAAVAKLGEQATRAGSMIEAGGLLPSSQGARVHVSGGKISVIDGPFPETKELVGGYAIFELKSKEEAVRMARDFMQVHADILGPSYEGELEIRPLMPAPPGAAK